VLLHGTERDFPHVHLHVCVDLDRVFARGALEEAVRRAIEAFPVLGCRYRASWWRDRWLPWEGDVAELVHVEQTDDVEAATRVQVARRFDHTTAPTWRLASLERDGGSRLIVSLHHMTGDGGGVKALANVVVSALCGVAPHPPTTMSRSMLAPAWSLRLRDLPVLALEFLREGLQPLSILRVRRLRPLPRGGGDPEPDWRTVTSAIHRTEGATINDGMVATVARLAAKLADRGPVAAGYTIDLRRYLPPSSRITNLHGVALVVVPRDRLEDPEGALRAVAERIGVQKRRLPGLAYTLLPLLLIGWLPHGLLRRVGRLVLNTILGNLNRALAVTNIGSLDETLAPLGESATAASIVGPFVHGLPVPVITATGFRDELTFHVQATGALAPRALDELAGELEQGLA